jgi:phospholipase C
MIAPTRKSEHATNHPCDGEDLTARILKTLSEFPEIYAKTAFILNYDEGGQFFDHAWCPTPPLSPSEGISTVTVEGEVNRDVLTSQPAPIGLGFRVPLLIVSPWTRGNIVVSEAFDHTSVIKFLEYRFNVSNPNLSPWRRAMVGDLTSAFDFENPNYDWPRLPHTRGYVAEGEIECRTLPPPTVPVDQEMPRQEPGTRISRALPYEFVVRDTLSVGDAASLDITVDNLGKAGAPFILFDVANLATINPRQYAVESNKSITDHIMIPSATSSSYHYALMGINGFVREFSGDASASSFCASISASLTYSAQTHEVVIVLTNNKSAGTAAVEFSIRDNAYNQLGGEVLPVIVEAGSSVSKAVNTRISGHWYDLTVSVKNSDTDCLNRRFMGRMEIGKDSISDPAMAAGLPGLWNRVPNGQHPKIDDRFRHLERVEGVLSATDKDAHFYLEKVIDPI